MEPAELLLPVLIAIFGPYLAAQVFRYIRGPRLKATFLKEPPMFRLASRAGISMDTYEIHFLVTNEGHTQAEKVEAWLEELWPYGQADKPTKVESFFPVRMRYDSQGTEYISVNPGRRVPWNLAYVLPVPVQQHPWIKPEALVPAPGATGQGIPFYLDLKELPFNQPNYFLTGKYGIKISLYSENAGRRNLYLKLGWAGKWEPKLEDMFHQIDITEGVKFG